MRYGLKFSETSLCWGVIYRLGEGTEGRKGSEDCICGLGEGSMEWSQALIKE